MTNPPNPYTPPQIPPGGPQAPPAGQLNYDPAQVAEQIRKLNTKSFLFGVPGLLLQGVGNTMQQESSTEVLGGLLLLVGLGLLIAGLAFYARSRGQSGWFGLLGLLSCIGLIILAVLPKKCLLCSGPVKKAQCQQCGAPGAR